MLSNSCIAKLYITENLMALSSKAVIRSIIASGGSFTRKDLINIHIEKKGTELKKHSKKSQKKSPSASAKDLSVIDSVLRELKSWELVNAKAGRYSVKNSLQAEGRFVSRKGGGIVVSRGLPEIEIRREDAGGAATGDTVLFTLYDIRRGTLYGKISSITNRKNHELTARYSRTSQGLFIYTRADSPSGPELCVERKRLAGDENRYRDKYMFYTMQLTGKSISGREVCVPIDSYHQNDESGDFKRICCRHSLPGPHGQYSELSQKNLPNDKGSPRKDYRKFFTVTIDGADAKDFDDAVSLEKTDKGLTLYVHIADVSSYVTPGGELDSEAFSRGTSYYIGNNVIPMLPETLSNDLCSLRHGVDRLCLTAEITFDTDAKPVFSEFHRGIIRVNKRLTYEQAHELIASKKITHTARSLRTMNRLAEMLFASRLKTGRLDLALKDAVLDYDNGRVKSIRYAERLTSHRLIEEFMLSANEAVSKFIKETGIPSLYRIHEEMSPEKFAALKTFLKVYGLKPGKGEDTGMAVQKVLHDVSGRENEQVVNLVVLKSLMQAFYGTTPAGHFGLGFRDYTHFTSPIRRYPDLIVHRCLKSIIDRAKPPYTSEELSVIGEKSSEMERIAQKAERDMVKLKSCRLMKDNIGNEYNATVSGIGKYGMFITLHDMPIEGMVPLKNLTDDYYLVNEDDFTIVGRKSGRRYRLGDTVRLRLSEVDPVMMRIDFETV